jgi:hypothetical protein
MNSDLFVALFFGLILAAGILLHRHASRLEDLQQRIAELEAAERLRVETAKAFKEKMLSRPPSEPSNYLAPAPTTARLHPKTWRAAQVMIAEQQKDAS